MAKAAAFLLALQLMESGGDYQAVNTLGFLGAYQFGEAALIDLGYVRRDSDVYNNDFSGGWTGKNGIRSRAQFLANERVQDRAAEEWLSVLWHYISSYRLQKYAWTDVGGHTLTPAGMLGAAHLLGAGALDQYVRSNGRVDPRDPYGMPISSYMDRLGQIDVPFGPDRPYQMASN